MTRADAAQKLIQILSNRGLIPAGDLARELGVSRATLARLLSSLDQSWLAVGKTRNLQYGLLRSISDLEVQQSLFRVNEQGKLLPVGTLSVLHDHCFVVEPGAQCFESLPPEISDMAPQGFMGRVFCALYAEELRVPPRLQSWSDDHVFKTVALRGDDLPGNLIVGNVSASRWQKLSSREIQPTDFPAMVESVLDNQPAGSSAGGEQPKFSAVVKGEHVLVKFAGPMQSAVQTRWRDLLICEHLAAEVLKKSGVSASETEFYERDGFAFLQVKRFDRVGLRGRRPYLSLAAVDNFHFGEQDSWAACALRLQKIGRMSGEEVQNLLLLDAFARLIGDSDRHFYNVGVLPVFESNHDLQPKKYVLAPAFDKLPMFFAPVDDRLIQRDYRQALPTPEVMSVWPQALEIANNFWHTVLNEKSISSDFRKIAESCHEA